MCKDFSDLLCANVNKLGEGSNMHEGTFLHHKKQIIDQG